VESLFGYEDALKYINGYKSKVANKQPIITTRGRHQTPPQDMYFKGALFLHTLRNAIGDERWWPLVRAIYEQFKYKNIMTEDLVAFVNARTRQDWTTVFDQYLRHTALPTLELKSDAPGTVSYRWVVDTPTFGLPVKAGERGRWQTIFPTTKWQTMQTPLPLDTFEVATDLFYVNVTKK
jgi:aminopeptidase N